MQKKYKRCLIKLSGEAFSNSDALYNLKFIKSIANQITKLNNEDIQCAIVIGGGNIWRGKEAQKIELDTVNADYMGMIATIMNSIVLDNHINKIKSNTSWILSKLPIFEITKLYNFKDAIELLENNKIVILAGGTGSPLFTTDTSAVLRAIEINADIILMAKNGTEGVYDSDPNKNKNAKFYDKITYKDIENKKLGVMDNTACTLAQSHNIKMLVFDINQNSAIYNAIKGNIKHTLVY